MMMASEWLFHERLTTMETTLIMPTYHELLSIMEEKPRFTSPASTSRVPLEFRKYLFNYISGLDGNKIIKQQIPGRKEYTSLTEGLRLYAQQLASKT